MSRKAAVRVEFRMVVDVEPEWHHIQLLRATVLNSVAVLFREQNFCQAIGMVAVELLENAIKYGAWSKTEDSLFRIHVHGTHADSFVCVEVHNPIEPGEHEVPGRLRETLAWIESFESPHDAYNTKFHEIMTSDDDSQSGLGLIRIAHEGRCKISASVVETGYLCVAASCPLPTSSSEGRSSAKRE